MTATKTAKPIQKSDSRLLIPGQCPSGEFVRVVALNPPMPVFTEPIKETVAKQDTTEPANDCPNYNRVTTEEECLREHQKEPP